MQYAGTAMIPSYQQAVSSETSTSECDISEAKGFNLMVKSSGCLYIGLFISSTLQGMRLSKVCVYMRGEGGAASNNRYDQQIVIKWQGCVMTA